MCQESLEVSKVRTEIRESEFWSKGKQKLGEIKNPNKNRNLQSLKIKVGSLEPKALMPFKSKKRTYGDLLLYDVIWFLLNNAQKLIRLRINFNERVEILKLSSERNLPVCIMHASDSSQRLVTRAQAKILCINLFNGGSEQIRCVLLLNFVTDNPSFWVLYKQPI